MSAVTITPGEYPAARVRHTNYTYAAAMSWGPDYRATARHSSDLAASTFENVVSAAWQVRRAIGRKIDAREDFTNEADYVTIVGHMGAGEYVVTFVPRYAIGGQ